MLAHISFRITARFYEVPPNEIRTSLTYKDHPRDHCIKYNFVCLNQKYIDTSDLIWEKKINYHFFTQITISIHQPAENFLLIDRISQTAWS